MSVLRSTANSNATRNALRSRSPVKTEIARGEEEKASIIAAFKAEGLTARASKFNNGTSYPCFIVRAYN